MDSSKYLSIRRFVTAATGPDGLWGTPIVCAIACTQVVIRNVDGTNAQAIRTDPADGDTELALASNTEWSVCAHSSGDPVFQAGETICRVAPVSGAGPVVCTFIR